MNKIAKALEDKLEQREIGFVCFFASMNGRGLGL
jgi:hypothetical protein